MASEPVVGDGTSDSRKRIRLRDGADGWTRLRSCPSMIAEDYEYRRTTWWHPA